MFNARLLPRKRAAEPFMAFIKQVYELIRLGPILPEKIIKRKKRGFNSPMAIWLKTSLHEILQDTLSSKTINQHGLFKSDFIQSLITEHLSGQRDNSYRLWSLLCFQLWYDQFIAPSKNPKTTAQFIPDATPSCWTGVRFERIQVIKRWSERRHSIWVFKAKLLCLVLSFNDSYLT